VAPLASNLAAKGGVFPAGFLIFCIRSLARASRCANGTHVAKFHLKAWQTPAAQVRQACLTRASDTTKGEPSYGVPSNEVLSAANRPGLEHVDAGQPWVGQHRGSRNLAEPGVRATGTECGAPTRRRRGARACTFAAAPTGLSRGGGQHRHGNRPLLAQHYFSAEGSGPFDPGLAEQYLALGKLYEVDAEYDKAIDTYAKAEHISRMTHGLHAPEQFLPVKRSVDCYLAKGDFPAALERREYLVYLHREHYGFDAAEVVPALRELGDMYFDAFERGIQRNPELPMPELSFGPESGFEQPETMSAIETAFHWLDQARTQYFASIRNLVLREDYANPMLVDLESDLIETLFLEAFRRNIEIDPMYFLSVHETQARDTLNFDRETERLQLYRGGEEAFSRILTYLRANPQAQPVQVAEAMLELGDWHLLFGKEARGREQYEAARTYLAESGVGADEISALMNPAVPVQLPVFRDAPHIRSRLARNDTPAVSGYIDVALTLADDGDVEAIEVLGKSENANEAFEARLKKVLRNAPFRPRIAGGEDASKVQLRYNFAQL
jgi:tetratricopeptide (TPR) repeat protein